MAWLTYAYAYGLNNRGRLSSTVPIGGGWPTTIVGEREGAVNNTDLVITVMLMAAYGLAIGVIIYTYRKVKAIHKAGRERVNRLRRAGRL